MQISDWMGTSGVKFGTSGARGLVVEMTDKICFAYVVGFLQYLKTVDEFKTGGNIALAGDLRPSTPRILKACVAAIEFCGGKAIFCGYVPTPTLCFYAYRKKIPSLMVTGSHIPDDRNGIKFNRAEGEFLKPDEVGMREQDVILPKNIFDKDGMLLAPPQLPPEKNIISDFIERYKVFFGRYALENMHIGVYQHSAVGRDILIDIVKSLGGEAVALARSDIFIPVDTEAVREEDYLLAKKWVKEEDFDAIITTDGDSDRPLIADKNGIWMRGDILGILAATYLQAQAIATPVSSNTALEKLLGDGAHIQRTKIGSPYVIEAINKFIEKGLMPSVGYEANGGFLLGSHIERNGHILRALPTRDSILPMLCALMLAKDCKNGLVDVLKKLPERYTASDRLKDIPSRQSLKRIENIKKNLVEELENAGFIKLCGNVLKINEIDGLRIIFESEEIIHFRPSGNAPELRLYVEAVSLERADYLLKKGLKIMKY